MPLRRERSSGPSLMTKQQRYRHAIVWLIGGSAWAVVGVFGDPAWRGLWRTTLGLGLAVSLPVNAVGASLAHGIGRLSRGIRTIAVAAIVAWALVPLYVQAAAWKPIFGWAARLLLPAVVEPSGAAAWWCTWWIHTSAAIPWGTLIFLLVDASLPDAWHDQTRLLRRRRAAWWRATSPYQAIAVTASTVWVMVVVATDISVTDLYRIRTLAEALYLQFALSEAPWAAGLHWESMLLVGTLAALAGLATMQVLPLVGQRLNGGNRSTDRAAMRCWTGLLIAAGVVWIALPACGLAYAAGLEPVSIDGNRVIRWNGLKLLGLTTGIGPYGQTFALSRLTSGSSWYDSEWYWSIVITATSAAVTTVVATFLAIGAAGRRRTAALLLTISVLLAIPSPQWGIWIVYLFSYAHHPSIIYLYDQTIVAPVLATILRSLPLVTLVLWGIVRTVPRVWFDEGKLVGRSRWWIFRRVVLPARWRLLLGVFYLAAAVSFGDVGATQPVLPPGMPTVTWRIFDLLHAGVDDVVAAFCLLLGAAAFLVVLGATWAMQRLRVAGRQDAHVASKIPVSPSTSRR